MTPPSSSPTLTASNRTFFDSLAAKYDIQPWQKHLSHRITTYIQQNFSFIGISAHSDDTTITLLDYACGTGMLSRALGPSVTTIRAIDLSPNMISRYTDLAATSSIPSVRNARAIVGNLLTDEDEDAPPALELNGPEFHNFDIVAVGGGLHHFPDPAKAISRLAERLNVGGVLVIFDFMEEEEGGWVMPSEAEHTIHKHGFSEGEMREMMEGSGLGGFGWREMEERLEIRVSEDRAIERKGFLARAEKV